MKRNMLSFVFLATLLAGALGIIGTAQAILFTGNTNTSSPTTIDTFLTYTGASFVNIDVPIGPGPTSLTNLGTFTLNVCGSRGCEEPFGSQDGITDFTLRITFTDPVVSGSPALFTADIFGTILRSGNSNNIGSGSLLTIDSPTPLSICLIPMRSVPAHSISRLMIQRPIPQHLSLVIREL
jgi:hypothetical protein